MNNRNDLSDLKRDAGSYEDERPENNDLAYNVVKMPDVLVEQGKMEQLAELYCRLCSLLQAVSQNNFAQAKALQDKQLALHASRQKLDSYKKR